MSGLFSTFNIARRGMSVSQKQIDVTTHNISNANTEGFSRQRAEAVTTKPFGMPSLHSIAEPGQLGTGAEIKSIKRIRDSFLDYQVRNESSTLGKYQTRANYLSEIENILSEPSDTGLSTVITNFYKSWDELNKQASGSNARTVVVQQSLALTNALNQTSTQLNNLQKNAQEGIKAGVFDVNNILDQVQQLNKEIRAVKVAGNEPNDLMDKRDLLLDKLSSKFNITVDKAKFDTNIVKSADNKDLAFVTETDDQVYQRLSVISSIDAKSDSDHIVVEYYKLGNSADASNKETLKINKPTKPADYDTNPVSKKAYDDKVNGMIKTLGETRVLWADKDGKALLEAGGDPNNLDYDKLKLFQPSSGELRGLMSIQEDVNGYKDQLDKLAKSIAFSVNAVYTGEKNAEVNTRTDKSGNPIVQNPFFVNKETSDSTKYGETEKDITAANITINDKFINDVMQLKIGKDDYSGEGDGTRALAISKLKDALIKIENIGSSINSRNDLFTNGGNDLKGDGNMEFINTLTGTKSSSYFKDTVDRLGVQAQESNRMVNNQENLLASFEESRNSVSGVSIDEETANLIQYQHTYQANAKIVSTLDQLLDVVINGLKR